MSQNQDQGHFSKILPTLHKFQVQVDWLLLPDPAWLQIVAHLAASNPRDVCSLGYTCRQLYGLACTALRPKPPFCAADALQCPFLATLDLGRCRQVPGAELAQLRHVSTLRNLFLTGCQIQADTLAAVQQLPQLRHLKLADCAQLGPGAGHLPVSPLAALPALERLNLSRCCKLSDACLGTVGRMGSLTALDISFCWNVSDAGVGELEPLHASLRELNVSMCTRLTDEACRHIARLAAIETLDLAWCSLVTDGGLRMLQLLPKMRELNLTACRLVSTAARAELEASSLGRHATRLVISTT